MLSTPRTMNGELVAGRYQLTKCLGRGGMGEVFAAIDVSENKSIALKRLLPGAREHRKIAVHFMREYHTLASLKHPRIVQVYDYGVADETPYYTMELLDGNDLSEVLPLPYRDACLYLRDVASSLALLHARRLLHRDVSTRNIRRTRDGHCKLIDFGAMMAFGAPTTITGTPPFVPPETLHGASLDQRSDLYALGAVAYQVLTGQHAYRVTDLAQLPEAWATPLQHPSKLVGGLPRELDDIVMALLQFDPARRPDNAAEVIHWLSAAGELEDDAASEGVARSFFISSALCGRERHKNLLVSAMKRMLAGEGGAFAVTGHSGSGRTRLLTEAALIAQTLGVCVARASARRHRANGTSLARELLTALQQSAPLEARQAGADKIKWPEDALPTDHTRRSDSSALQGRDARAELQRALTAFVTEVAASRPLLLAIDDCEHADEFSAAFVAALGHQVSHLRVMLLFTQASPAANENIIEMPRFSAETIELGDLDRAHSDALILSMFGTVPNLEFVCDSLFRAAHGNPKLTVQLVENLMDRGLIQYVGGAWVLPSDIHKEPLPSEIAARLRFEAQTWSDNARRLAELLSLRRSGTSAELCVALGDNQEQMPVASLDALNELVAKGVLESAGDEYVFTQEAMRTALHSSIDPNRAEEMHKRWAQTLLNVRDSSLAIHLEAGWHLTHTPDELRGADLLAEVSPEVLRRGVAMAVAIPAIEMALQIYERHNRPLEVRLRLRSMLVLASYLFDYRLAARYGEVTLAQLHEAAGLVLAERLSRWLSGGPAFVLAAIVNEVQRLFTPRRRRGPATRTALIYFIRSALGLMGVYTSALDPVGTSSVFQRLRPLGSSVSASARAAYLASQALVIQPLGREADLSAALQTALHALGSKPHIFMSRLEYLDLRVGLLTADGVNECYREGSEALQRADLLSATGSQLGMLAAERIRMLYHLCHGDPRQAEPHRRAVELLAIQGGTTWQLDWFAVPAEGLSAALWIDLVALSRTIERLGRLVAQAPSLKPLRNGLEIAYTSLSGKAHKAVELAGPFLELHPPRSLIGWAPLYAAIIEAMVEVGQTERALALSEHALSFVSDADHTYVREDVLTVTLCQHVLRLAAVPGIAAIVDESIQAMRDAANRSGVYRAILLAEAAHERRTRLLSPVPSAPTGSTAPDSR